MPGRTRTGSRTRPFPDSGFNGGPGDCPAGHATTPQPAWSWSLQWRAGRLPGRTWAVRTMAENWQLQWRAGRLPGRTRTGSRTRPFPDSGFNGGPGDCPAGRQDRPRPWPYHDSASMEGRAIARPDTPRHPSRRGHGRFNGGPGDCPAGPDPGGADDGRELAASMEGRAIARPDTLTALRTGEGDELRLQWRAGRLPGRTP